MGTVRTPARDTMLASTWVTDARSRCTRRTTRAAPSSDRCSSRRWSRRWAARAGASRRSWFPADARSRCSRTCAAACRSRRRSSAGRNTTRAPAAGRREPLPRRFWLYAGYTAINMLGFATWAVLAFHLHARHVGADSTIAIMYAVAMGAAGAGALASGWAFDRVGLRVLLVVPALTALVRFLSFTTTVAVAWIGAAVWGLGLGVHESTMRAAVAQLVPAAGAAPATDCSPRSTVSRGWREAPRSAPAPSTRCPPPKRLS